MATRILLLLIGYQIVLSAIPAAVQGQKAAPELMSELCMGCICEAASKCDRARQCRNGVCGLFAITRPYWEDAGKPVIPGDAWTRQGAFERCVIEPYCAARTVQEYMARYPKDCDGNGVVNCEDYAAIHHLGRGCQGTMNNVYRREFQTCQRHVKPAEK